MNLRAATFLLACLSSVVVLFAQSPPRSDRGVIAGRVVDAFGKAVDDASVSLAGPAVRSAVAADGGTFTFDGLPDGIYVLHAAKAGYIAGAFGRREPDGPAAPITLAAGQRIDGVNIRLWKYASISGTVRDTSGDPVTNAEVRALRATWQRGRPTWQATGGAHTDDRGQYRLGELVPGTYIVLVPFRRLTVPASFDLGGASHVPPERFIQSGPHTATLQSSGQPIETAAGAVRVYRTTSCPQGQTLTDGLRIEIQSGEDRMGMDCVIESVPGWTLSGTLTNADGSHVIPTELRLVPTDIGAIAPLASMDSDKFPGGTKPIVIGAEDAFDPVIDLAEFALSPADGTYAFGAVPSGQYRLRVLYTPEYYFANVPPDQRLGRMMALGTSALNDALDPPHAVSPPGVAPTFYATDDVLVDDRDVKLDVTLRPAGRLRGRIEFDGTSQTPSSAATRTVHIDQEPLDGWGTESLRYYVGRDWTFTTYGAPPGRYFIDVSGDFPGWHLKSVMIEGHDASAMPVEIGERDIDDVVVAFTDTPDVGTLSGRVTTDGVAPDAQAEVIAVPADRRVWVDGVPVSRFVKSSSTGPHGEYELDDLRPGDYLVGAVSAAAGSAAAEDAAAFFEQFSNQALAVHVAKGARAQDLRTLQMRLR